MKALSFLSLIVVFLIGWHDVAASETQIAADGATLEIVPATVPPKCERAFERRQSLFDLCADQLSLLAEARRLAKASSKTVLVSYGADWCIWCHVFEAHLLGGFGRFTYPTSDGPWTMREKAEAKHEVQAAALKAYVAANFVVVNIAQESNESGLAVLRKTLAEERFSGGLPFIFALNHNGQFSGAIESSDVEVRRDGKKPYRGYDRAKLLVVLQSLVVQK